jgi:hypothetical protein
VYGTVRTIEDEILEGLVKEEKYDEVQQEKRVKFGVSQKGGIASSNVRHYCN